MATVQILDGGLGTSLGDLYNVKFTSTSTPLWASHMLISDPTTLEACQSDFGRAGVDILLTATYQVSPEGFVRTKTAQHPEGIPRGAIVPYLRTAVDIALRAKVRDTASVALSLGPYGACMIPGQEYSGQYDAEHDSEESLYVWHLERLKMFVEAGVEGLKYVAFETLPRLDEVRAVRRAMADSGINVPFWIACVFPREDELLPDGSGVGDVVKAMLSGEGPAPWGVGINCTKMHKLSGLVDSFGRAVKEIGGDVPSLVLYPDGTNGEVYNTTTQVWEKPSEWNDNVSDNRPWEVQLAQVVNESYEKGHFKSFLVGGCCKASHHDIKKLGEQFKAN
ncbi:unnamed protein product [Penicillium salamii]|uniref:Hcy-binding domain-containing protein n=1 Tax=Penicillium salamii TaxID=1612424 RepID=A0A9W4JP46_9EURO|nr:unnamed protein product [Penicillium salamii]CAG8346650.1 unnamed protein product [Penicillium salamii]CAG8368078.1 unnamed protein product [Penicillium salamii]CAG8376886.1 unnamed protein product [Penicillium salamii]CAG8379235.1 unnamed protein product [Penicillium salamii]